VFYTAPSGNAGATATLTPRLTIAVDGTATFAKTVTVSPVTGGAYLVLNGVTGDAEVLFQNSGYNSWAMGTNVGDASTNFNIYNYTTSTVDFSINKSTSAITNIKSLTVDNINLDGSTITGLANENTIITAYSGKAIAIEGVTFDGGVVTGATSITSTGAIASPYGTLVRSYNTGTGDSLIDSLSTGGGDAVFSTGVKIGGNWKSWNFGTDVSDTGAFKICYESTGAETLGTGITALKIAVTGTATFAGDISSTTQGKLLAWVNYDGTTAADISGTYLRNGTAVEVSFPSDHHGQYVDDVVWLNFTSGTAADGMFVITSIIDEHSFRVTHPTSGNTSGNVTLQRRVVRSSFGVRTVNFNGTGDHTIVFNRTLSNPNYVVTIATSGEAAGQHIVSYISNANVRAGKTGKYFNASFFNATNSATRTNCLETLLMVWGTE
jgi:hypothetical protein